jgi:hypothetical protein
VVFTQAALDSFVARSLKTDTEQPEKDGQP